MINLVNKQTFTSKIGTKKHHGSQWLFFSNTLVFLRVQQNKENESGLEQTEDEGMMKEFSSAILSECGIWFVPDCSDYFRNLIYAGIFTQNHLQGLQRTVQRYIQ